LHYIKSQNVATFSTNLYRHPLATLAHKTKITITNIILGQNEMTG